MDPITRAIKAFINRSEGHSYRCYTHPRYSHTYVDEVVTKNGVTAYYLHGNNIATLTDEYLLMRTMGYPTLLTMSRLDAILSWLNIPCRVHIRMSPIGLLYLRCGERIGPYEVDYIIPELTFISIDLKTHRVTNGARYIPSFIIRPSRARYHTLIRRRDGSYYEIRDTQYLVINGERFKYIKEYGGWVHVRDLNIYEQSVLSDPEA